MFRRLLFTIGALVVVLALAAPAGAAGFPQPGGALRTCQDLHDTRDWYNPGTDTTEPLTAYWIPLADPGGTVEDFPIQGLDACVTTLWRNGGTLPIPAGGLSILAYNNQCQMLESQGVIAYPYDFYGNPDYHADNRFGCIYYLRAFHTGALPPGPAQ